MYNPLCQCMTCIRRRAAEETRAALVLLGILEEGVPVTEDDSEHYIPDEETRGRIDAAGRRVLHDYVTELCDLDPRDMVAAYARLSQILLGTIMLNVTMECAEHIHRELFQHAKMILDSGLCTIQRLEIGHKAH